MNCDEVQQRISEFVDNELDSLGTRMLFTHLGSCDECWAYYRRIDRLHAVMSKPEVAKEISEVESSTERTSPTGKNLTSRPTRRWLRTRHAMTPASFLLGSYIAFVVGVILTLLLLPASEVPRQSTLDQWTPLYYQIPTGNPGTEIKGEGSLLWRRR